MKNILFLLTFFSGINVSYSQWVQTDGPYGPINVSSIIQHDSLLLSFTDCGLFSKTNLASSWGPNSKLYFTSHAKKNDSLFIGTPWHGIKLIDLNNPNDPVVNINPIDADVMTYANSCLYVGNGLDGFFKSVDNGVSFTNHNIGLPTDTLSDPSGGAYYITNVSSIEVTDSNIFCGTNKGVYRIDLNLTYWEEKNNGLPLSQVTLIHEVNDTLYTAIDNKLFRSVDNGEVWNLLVTSYSDITSLLVENDKLYASTSNNGILYSPFNGSNWSSFNLGLTDLSVNVVSKYESTIVCGTSEDGFFELIGNQWGINNSGMICSKIKSLASSNNTLFVNTKESVYKLNADDTWSDVSPNISHDIFSSFSSMNNTVFLSGWNDLPTSPYRQNFIVYSTDEGVSWNNLINLPTFVGGPGGSFLDPWRIYCNNGKLYVFENNMLYYTTDFGLTWIDNSLPAQYCNGFTGFLNYNSVSYAATCGDGELLKLDSNLNWILSNNGLPMADYPNFLGQCDSALFTFISGLGMYASFDDGDSWSYASNGLNTNLQIYGSANHEQYLFVATSDGVFQTSDYGKNWYSMNQGLENTITLSLEFLNGTLYAGTVGYGGAPGDGVWKIDIDNIPLSVSEINNNQYGFKVYPNPTADYLTIDAISIDFESFKIFDLTGRQVISGKLISKEIDIRNISNGVYLLRLYSNGETYKTKIVKR